MQDISHIVAQVSGRLGEFSQSDIVVGQPIELSGHTVVTLSSVSVGFGGGGGQAEGNAPAAKERGRSSAGGGKGKGAGGASGGGGKVRPVAVVVFGAAGVQILPVPDPKGPLEKLIDRIPDLVDKFSGKGEGEAKRDEE